MTDRKRAIRRAYDDLAGAYEEARSSAVPEPLWALLDRLPGDARVLDAGCGSGRPATAALSDHAEVLGLDFAREQLRLARAAVPGGALAQGDVTALPLAAASVDGVCSLNALIHVPNDQQGAAIGEFARALRPGGWLLCTVGAEEWIGRNPDWLDAGVEMRWSMAGLDRTRECLADAGLVVEAEWTVDDELGGEFPALLARLE